MIRKLNESDRQDVMTFLKPEKSFNLFIIGDIESFGFDSDFQELWADIDDNGKYHATLLRYYSYFIYYTVDSGKEKEFADIIRSAEKSDVVSGKKDCIDKIKEYLDSPTEKVTYFAELNEFSSNDNFENVKLLTTDKIDELMEMKEQVIEFGDTPSATKESYIKTLESKSGRYYYIEDDDKIVSTAQTSAENSESAMIIGVCTLADYRGKGYASKCMKKLCSDLVSENKSLCLFYDNPDAGRIYRNIGFKETGMWSMLILDK